MSVKEFWVEFRAQEAALREAYPDGALFVKPTDNRRVNTYGGDAVQVSIATAARMLTEGTATRASDADIAQYNERAQENKMRSEAQTLRTAGFSKMIFGSAERP